MSKEQELWQELNSTHLTIQFETWQEWNQLYIERVFPAFSKVVQSYTNLYNAQTKDKISTERRLRGLQHDQRYTYGESSWEVFLEALQVCRVSSSDRFVDLGCGKGQLCLYMKMKYDIPTFGVELTPLFIKSAQMIAREHDLEVNFVSANLINFNFKLATVFYITCTCFDEPFMAALTQKLLKAPSGSRIVIITMSIDHPQFELLSEGQGLFNWGKDSYRVYKRL